MDILQIPFHKLLSISKHSEDDSYIFCMDERPQLLNHLGTIHACAQLSLAEASSGEFLQRTFADLKSEVVPVIRRTEVKYSTPANGSLYSKANFESGSYEAYMEAFQKNKRMIIPLKVEVFNAQKKRTLSALFEWFITAV